MADTDTAPAGTAAPGTPRRSPLHDRHVAAGARFAPFGGWEMPLEYAGGGVLAEHRAVREAVGVFDVSHLGKATVTGPGALELVDAVLTNSVERIVDGQAQYTLCCDSRGGVVDDLIAYRQGADEVFLVPNAANTAAVVEVLAAAAPDGVEVANRHTEFALVAVQGPASADLLAAVGLPARHPYMAFVGAALDGAALDPVPVTVCRTGYTGEHGYELLLPADRAGEVWDALLAAGATLGARPCGLGARDTLRTEMGYALHGQDISADISPVQARLGWAVGWRKPAFAGRDALLAERAAGPARRLWGIRSAGRAIPRPGMTVTDPAGAAVGTVTSGTFSPTLRVGIGLALLDAPLEPGAQVSVAVRGREEPFAVARPPFVDRSPS